MSSCRRIGNDPESTEWLLELDQYDDYTMPFVITTGEGTVADPELPMDCTGCEVIWEIRRFPTSPTVTAEFTIDWTAITVGEGNASIYVDIPCGKTPQEAASQYFHHLILVDSLGHRRTIAKGPCLVNRGVPPSV